MSQNKINQVLNAREQVSALADGCLQGPDFDAAVQAVAEDEDARASWELYHLVGDVLRSSELAVHGRGDAFLTRLRQRLQVEEPEEPSALPEQIRTPVPPAANDPVFRWKVMAAVASLAAVAVIGWPLVIPSGSGPRELAQRPPQDGVVVEGVAQPSVPQRMIRDPRLDEMLAAHRQVGAGPVLQETSGFLRNATFADAER